MMLIKNGYNNKIVRAKKFCELTPIEIKLSEIDHPEYYKGDEVFIEPEPEVCGYKLTLGAWRRIMDGMFDILIEDYK